jgi:adenylate kinase family enzyme
MRRVVILGRGASGKSTLARRLGEVTGLPVVEPDKVFWQPGLAATPRDEWIAAQEVLVAKDRWIIDGDLGQFDVVETRLRAADTVIFVDFSFLFCAHRAIQRSSEHIDFWWWVLAYRWQSPPVLLKAIADYAPNVELHVFRGPESLQRFVDQLALTARVIDESAQ